MTGYACVMATLTFAVVAGACRGPTVPTPMHGTALVAVTAVLIADGSTQFYEHGVDVTLTITATDDLVPRTEPRNLPFYLCLSEDGVHFTHLCQAGRGLGSEVRARVHGPPASSHIVRTSHLIAFVVPAEDFGTPVSAFSRYGRGDEVPSSALAVHVLPWVIQWR